MIYTKFSILLCFLFFQWTIALLDPELIESFSRQETSSALIYFTGGNSEVIRNIKQQSFSNRLNKIKALTNSLHSLSNIMQGPVQDFLRGYNVSSKSFWASNQMIVKNANLALLQQIDLFPQVSRIRKIPEISLNPATSSVSQKLEDSIPWGITKIQADRVWEQFGVMGQGVVVANIDTGVRRSHETLRNNFRMEKGWYDPYFNTTEPNDDNGHGTHTMATIAGSGVGIAPRASWIACRGCANDKCDAAELLACGQFILSPTNPDGTDPQPSMIPDIVSNSWGSPGGHDDWFNSTIDAWTEAGILHVFAMGNSGPFCGSGSSPGDQIGVFGIGSTDEQERLSIFSSKGPANFLGNEYIKPDLTAPGTDIYSAWATGDTDYKVISGTSMATPHVGGTMALMLSATRLLSNNSAMMDFDQVQKIIKRTADTKDLTVAFPNSRCSGREVKWPNNEFGYGRLNALRAVAKTLKKKSNEAI